MFKQLVFQTIYSLPIEQTRQIYTQLVQSYYVHLSKQLPPDEFASRTILNCTLDVLYHGGHEETLGSDTKPELYN